MLVGGRKIQPQKGKKEKRLRRENIGVSQQKSLENNSLPPVLNPKKG